MDVFPVVRELLLNVTKAFAKTAAGLTQGRLGVQIKMPGQAGQGKQQVAEFMFLLLCVRRCQYRCQFLVLFRNLFKDRCSRRPVKTDAGGLFA